VVEEGLVNVCLLARYETVKGRSPTEFWAWLLGQNSALAQRLEGARPAMEWLATANVSFGKTHPSHDGVLYCGDAAGYIHPLTGDGMAMAARSGELAAAIVSASLRDGLAGKDVAPLYERAWHREFGSRLRWAARIEPLLLSPRLAGVATQLLKRVPAFARKMVLHTRG
jgi:flavin-dependent dehydrogenase